MTRWIIPAAVSALFLVVSLVLIADEPLLGFIGEHQRSGWGAQIFLDLILAAFTAMVLIAPRARRAGVNLAPWVVFTVCTGSIGLLALMARVLYLEQRAPARSSVPAT